MTILPSMDWRLISNPTLPPVGWAADVGDPPPAVEAESSVRLIALMVAAHLSKKNYFTLHCTESITHSQPITF